MKKIIYYVASSIDGYISGPNDDVSQFVYQGKGVEKYLADLKSFQTVIMGRKTYEFGYKFGVVPGQPSPTYSHMKHYIFSNRMKLENKSDQVEIKSINTEEVINIKNESPTDIYLCGGGQLAGWMLKNGLIDQLKVKLNPITLGGGVALFEHSNIANKWKLLDSERFDNGLLLLTYELEKN